MQFKSFTPATAALLLTSLAAPILADVTVTTYSDGNCGSAIDSYNINSATCKPLGGFSSMKLTYSGKNAGTITSYSKNDCGCPTCGSHGYSAGNFDCLNNFGFGAANAIGLSGDA